MLTKAQNAFENRLHVLGRQGQLYIVPTLDGLKLLALNLVLLVIGLVYANNYVLLFNFILFCLFVGSMFYTHFNLNGLKLISAKLGPLHVNERGVLILQFKSSSALGHHFLGASFKNLNFSSVDKSFVFSMKENSNKLKVDLPVMAVKRGASTLNRICVETRFPFHLFRAFTYFNLGVKVIAYPEKKHLGLHNHQSLAEEKNGSDEDFYLKNFHHGDPLKRVHWKKFAQTGKLFSKQMTSNDEQPIVLGFSRDDLSKEEKEKELSSICFGLHELHAQNIHYGLELGNLLIGPDLSHVHLNRCLKALAEYET